MFDLLFYSNEWVWIKWDDKVQSGWGNRFIAHQLILPHCFVSFIIHVKLFVNITKPILHSTQLFCGKFPKCLVINSKSSWVYFMYTIWLKQALHLHNYNTAEWGLLFWSNLNHSESGLCVFSVANIKSHKCIVYSVLNYTQLQTALSESQKSISGEHCLLEMACGSFKELNRSQMIRTQWIMREGRWRGKKLLQKKKNNNIADIILLDAYILELHKQSFAVVCVTLKKLLERQ